MHPKHQRRVTAQVELMPPRIKFDTLLTSTPRCSRKPLG